MKEIEIFYGEAMYETENSFYIIRQDTYCRLPKQEAPRHVMSPALADAIWHKHEGVWEMEDGDEYAQYGLRILPAGRPPGSIGLLTSPVIGQSHAYTGKKKVKNGS